MIPDEQLIRKRAGLLEAELDGDIVGLDAERGTCFGFNATATRVWKLLDQPLSCRQLREALFDEFDVDEDACRFELNALIADFEAKGLIEALDY